MRRKSQILLLIYTFWIIACNNYGILHKLEKPGNNSGSSADQASSEVFTTNNYIFVSSWVTLGDMSNTPYSECNGFTGAARADCGCTRAAAMKGLRKSSSHQFYAWLSIGPTPGPQRNPICRIQNNGTTGCSTAGSTPWFNTNGQIVFNNLAVFNSAPTNAVRYDENGIDSGANFVWTGSVAGAYSAENCTDWSSNTATPTNNRVGDRTSNSGFWENSNVLLCNTTQRVYCVASP